MSKSAIKKPFGKVEKARAEITVGKQDLKTLMRFDLLKQTNKIMMVFFPEFLSLF